MPSSRNTLRLPYWRFMRQWILNALAVWVVAPAFYIAIVIASMFVLGIFEAVLGSYSQLMDVILVIGFFVVLVPMAGIVIGGSIGGLQRNVVRRSLYYDLPQWQHYSMVGGVVGSLLVTGVFIMTPAFAPPETFLGLAMPAFIVGLVSGQAFALQKVTPHAWLWWVANIVGAIVFNYCAFAFAESMDLLAPIYSLAMLFWGAVLQAFIIGHVMVHLIEKYAQQPFAKSTPKTEPDPQRPPSVWDNAI
jgi:hypothetical protein